LGEGEGEGEGEGLGEGDGVGLPEQTLAQAWQPVPQWSAEEPHLQGRQAGKLQVRFMSVLMLTQPCKKGCTPPKLTDNTL
jgi:hypothetical protein